MCGSTVLREGLKMGEELFACPTIWRLRHGDGCGRREQNGNPGWLRKRGAGIYRVYVYGIQGIYRLYIKCIYTVYTGYM